MDNYEKYILIGLEWVRDRIINYTGERGVKTICTLVTIPLLIGVYTVLFPFWILGQVVGRKK